MKPFRPKTQRHARQKEADSASRNNGYFPAENTPGFGNTNRETEMAQDAGQAKVKKAMENDTVPQSNFSLIFYKVKALVPALNGQVNCPCAHTAGVR